MKQFINDMINLTEGQKLIKYWWLWAGAIIIVLSIRIYSKVSYKKQWDKAKSVLFKDSYPRAEAGKRQNRTHKDKHK